ncbi:Ig-like domain-containing protein [Microbispora hainanensis]|uniref:SbsA Ig-like domain-containing protein n=1 Tax=Microbispora hainanensis TaxID=568844 RepID=A0A544XNC5_9ACTN|nr:Ig-like domain-containing protein [Microbispora hainanensis]TQS06008.1 hypothetical protein FLX08_39680 [Microbispora hainanensis]
MIRFSYPKEPDPQTPQEWEDLKNDPERSRVYPGLPHTEAVSWEKLQELRENTDATFTVDSDDLLARALPGDEPDPSESSDTQPPTVVATGPEPGETEVSSDEGAWAVFSKPVSGGRFRLKGLDGTTVPGTTTAQNDDILTFDPDEPLAANTQYTAEVSAARDAAGNEMALPYVWSFTTGGTT